MAYDRYSRTNQLLMESLLFAGSFYAAFLIRFDGAIPAYHKYQFLALVAPLVVGRLLTNFTFGLHRIQWKFIGFRDALYTGRAFLAFSALLLLLRVALPPQAGILRVPASIITIELLLSLLGAMSLRVVRRYVYEHQSQQLTSPKPSSTRRLLLIGAGAMGARVAKEMSGDRSVEIVGFLDDDPRKAGFQIAGRKVLGPTSLLTEVIQNKKVDAVLVCIAPAARGSFNRLLAVLDGLSVTSKFVPTIGEILDAKDGLHLNFASVNGSKRSGNGRNANGHHSNGHSIEFSNLGSTTFPTVRHEIRDRKVLITGGGGFIGSTLAERLAKENDVILLDRVFNDQPLSFTDLKEKPNVRLVEADILESPVVGDLAREADIVIHAAAIVGVGRVCTYPRETLEINFAGTSRILKELEKSSRLERFVYFSTSEVFGVNSFRVNEAAPTAVGPAAEARWSYAIAKLAGEHLVKAYHRQSGTPVATVRPFNVFGPRRLGSHAMSGFILNALMGDPIEIHGDGSQIRSWCYIDDFCDGIMEMLARPAAVGEDFNIGNPQNTVTILQLAEQIVKLTRSKSEIQFIKSPFPDIEIRVPSLEKARRILDYQPKHDLRRGLELTVNWYQRHLEFFEAKLSRAKAVGAR